MQFEQANAPQWYDFITRFDSAYDEFMNAWPQLNALRYTIPAEYAAEYQSVLDQATTDYDTLQVLKGIRDSVGSWLQSASDFVSQGFTSNYSVDPNVAVTGAYGLSGVGHFRQKLAGVGHFRQKLARFRMGRYSPINSQLGFWPLIITAAAAIAALVSVEYTLQRWHELNTRITLAAQYGTDYADKVLGKPNSGFFSNLTTGWFPIVALVAAALIVPPMIGAKK